MKTLLFELTINRGSAARVSIGRVLSIDTTEIIRVEFIEFIEFIEFRKIDECVNCSVDLSYEIWKKKEKRKKVSFLTKEFLRNRFLRVIRCRVTNANGPR